MGAEPSGARADTAVQTSTGLSGIDLDVPRVAGRDTAGDVGNGVSLPLAMQAAGSMTSGRSLVCELASDETSQASISSAGYGLSTSASSGESPSPASSQKASPSLDRIADIWSWTSLRRPFASVVVIVQDGTASPLGPPCLPEPGEGKHFS